MTEVKKAREKTKCSLCGLSLNRHAINHEDKPFCCHGCQAVYQVLEAKGASLENFDDNPVFKQALKHGLISNPDLLDSMQKKKVQSKRTETLKLQLEIEQMWCFSCSKLIEYSLIQEAGVLKVFVDYTTDLAQIEYDPKMISSDEIKAFIAKLGYEPLELSDNEQKKIGLSLWLRFSIGAFCALNVMMASYPVYVNFFRPESNGFPFLFAYLAAAFSVPVVTYSAYPIWKRLLKGLTYGLYGMEMLVGVAVFSAFTLSCYNLFQDNPHIYFDSMSVIIVLVLLGKMIESKAKFSAREALIKLHKSLAKRGRSLLNDGSEDFKRLNDVKLGDTLVAYYGEKLVLDGVLDSEEIYVDESMMTGESLPKKKKKKDLLLAGSILLSPRAVYKASSLQRDSVLQNIIDCLQHDLENKPKYQRFADKVVLYFIPFVLFCAFASVAFTLLQSSWLADPSLKELAFTKALSILLISCPCALGVAAPLAEAATISALVSLGVIVRNRAALSELPKQDYFIFDKTGTLTYGSLSVRSGLENLSTDEKNILRAMAKQSFHPICRAVEQSILDENYSLPRVEEVLGRGMKAQDSEANEYLFGSANFLKTLGVHLKESETDQSIYIVAYFVKNKQLVSTLLFEDRLRESAKSLFKDLDKFNKLILSGDRESVVANLSKELDGVAYHAECFPLQKKNYIQEIQKEGHKVCFVGDGINDAPSITAANLGVSMLKASDISIQVSDIFITREDLGLISKSIELSKKGSKILKQNMFWAFFYNVIGMFLAIAGYLLPLYAAFAMVASSLIVCFNSLRIKRF